MHVTDLIRQSPVLNKILKDDEMMLYLPPPITITLHFNTIDSLLSGPLENAVKSEQKEKKVHRHSIPFTVSPSCKSATVEAWPSFWITKFSESITEAGAAAGKSEVANQAPIAMAASHLSTARALSWYLVTRGALWALRVAVTSWAKQRETCQGQGASGGLVRESQFWYHNL